MLRAFCVALVCALAAAEPVKDQSSGPPPFFMQLKTARWLAHNLTWGVLSTISSRDPTVGVPFGNPYSFSDGAVDSSTGIPYFYASEMDASMTDIFDGGNTKVTLALSENELTNIKACDIAQGGDPENPPCARLVLSGEFKNVSGTDEESVASDALFSRHPSMEDWPADHSWFFGKIDLESIWLIDIYGGAKILDVDDYFNVDL